MKQKRNQKNQQQYRRRKYNRILHVSPPANIFYHSLSTDSRFLRQTVFLEGQKAPKRPNGEFSGKSGKKTGGAVKRSSHREYNQIQTGIALSSDEKRAPKFLSEFFFYTVINRHDSKVSQFLYYTHAYTVSDMDRLVRPFRNVYKSQIPYASKILLPAGFPRCPLIHLRNRCPQTVFMDTIKL